MKSLPHISAVYTLLMLSAQAYGYDLAIPNTDGKTIYYNTLGDGQLEVTYQSQHRATPSYTETLKIPTTVSAEGKIYRVTAIGDEAFFNCRELQTADIPEGITTLGIRAFAWCDGIGSLSLPASVELIGANAFDGCYGLTDLSVVGSNSTICTNDDGIYSKDMTALIAYLPTHEGKVIIEDGTTEIKQGAFAACPFITGVDMPASLSTIGDNAFYFCSQLQEINIPKSVESIGHGAVSDCLSLKAINVEEGNASYTSHGGVLYNSDGTVLIQSPGSLTGEPDIPEGVTTIADEAMLRNYTLTTVHLPTTVTDIGEGAMIDCPRLTAVVIPASVSHIGPMAMAMCPELHSLYVYATDPQSIDLGEAVFVDTDNEHCTLYVPTGSEEAYASVPQWGEFKNIVGFDALKAQTIEWIVEDNNITVGNSILLTATSDSGLPVKYLLSLDSQGPAVLNGNDLTVLIPGTVMLTAYQSGNREYLPAIPVTRTFNVLTGIEDIMADISNIKVYGGVGSITIRGADEDATVHVYDLQGRSVYQGKSRQISVASGQIYIVHINGHVYKVAVK